MANLPRITTDGSRHNPQFWLGEKSVSVQVRSLLNYRLIELQSDGRLSEAASVAPAPRSADFDSTAAVTAMREFLGNEAKT